jgi:hypothetical protein
MEINLHLPCCPKGTIPKPDMGNQFVWEFRGEKDGYLYIQPSLRLPDFDFQTEETWRVRYVIVHPDVDDIDLSHLHVFINSGAESEKTIQNLIAEQVLLKP